MSYCSFHSFLAKTRFARTAVMWTVLAVLAAGCGDRERPLPTADGTSLRSTEQGRVVGYVGDYGNHVWRGIDYAKAPVGNLRWRAPENPSPWAETREALRQGAYCPQFVSRFGGVTGEEGEIKGNEDCLFLDIYAKRRETSAVPSGDERVPVLFWIHGGGNVIGHAGFYDGGFMAETHDVVVVAINYRLGPLGWFRHASLRDSESSAADRSGNFGTLDMIRALEWVRDNIAAFGGDPSNVTIFGESAGATNVLALLVVDAARGLFHRAIAQSPAGSSFTTLKKSETGQQSAEEIGEAWAAQFHESDSEDPLAALRKVSADEFLANLEGYRNVVAIDDWFMVDTPKNLFAKGRQYDVPMIIGTNSDEGASYALRSPHKTVDDYRENIQQRFGDSAETIFALYPVTKDDEIRSGPGILDSVLSGSPWVF